jgi:hypothetical protein
VTRYRLSSIRLFPRLGRGSLRGGDSPFGPRWSSTTRYSQSSFHIDPCTGVACWVRAISTLSQVLSRDRPLVSSIVLSLRILSILASYLGVSWDRLYEVSTQTFTWIRHPWNTLRWKLQRHRALADLFHVSLKYPTLTLSMSWCSTRHSNPLSCRSRFMKQTSFVAWTRNV